MKLMKLIFFCFLIHSAQSQHIIRGKVIDTADSSPIPGVNIIEDSLNKSITNKLGMYSILINELPTTLTFSMPGMLTRTVNVDTDSALNVFLKSFVLTHYFESQKIGLYFKSGIINNPIGGEVYLTSPYFLNSRLFKSSISYQTNLDDNRLIAGSLSLENIFFDQYFSSGLSLAYQKVSLYEIYNLTNRSAEVDLWHRYSPIDLTIGYSNLQISDAELVESYNGLIVRVSRYFDKIFKLEASAKIWVYHDLYGLKVQLERSFNQLHLLADYQKLDSYSEFNIGVGYLITYILRDPNRY